MVTPSVSIIESLAATVAPYTIQCLLVVVESAEGRTATRYVAAEPERLAIDSVETTADVKAGTVYKVVSVVAAGFD